MTIDKEVWDILKIMREGCSNANDCRESVNCWTVIRDRLESIDGINVRQDRREGNR